MATELEKLAKEFLTSAAKMQFVFPGDALKISPEAYRATVQNWLEGVGAPLPTITAETMIHILANFGERARALGTRGSGESCERCSRELG